MLLVVLQQCHMMGECCWLAYDNVICWVNVVGRLTAMSFDGWMLLVGLQQCHLIGGCCWLSYSNVM